MDMTDDHIDHITDIITKIIWCPDVSVFPQWQHRHGAPTKCLWNKMLISFFKKRMAEVVRRCRLLRCNQMMAAFLKFALVPNTSDAFA